jgi:hypothetical protein
LSQSARLEHLLSGTHDLRWPARAADCSLIIPPGRCADSRLSPPRARGRQAPRARARGAPAQNANETRPPSRAPEER